MRTRVWNTVIYYTGTYGICLKCPSFLTFSYVLRYYLPRRDGPFRIRQYNKDLAKISNTGFGKQQIHLKSFWVGRNISFTWMQWRWAPPWQSWWETPHSWWCAGAAAAWRHSRGSGAEGRPDSCQRTRSDSPAWTEYKSNLVFLPHK